MALFDYKERHELERRMRDEHRLPPGQSATLKWPVLHYGSVPRFDPDRWDFRIYGLVDAPVKLTWAEFNKLPTSETHSDFHCVTRWSRFDNDWSGVKFNDVLQLVTLKPEAKFVLVHAEQGYTANIPLAFPGVGVVESLTGVQAVLSGRRCDALWKRYHPCCDNAAQRCVLR